MGAATAIGVGLVASAAISYYGQSQAADAAQNAASAQADEAGRQRQLIMQQGKENQRLAMQMAEATPQELSALDRAYGAASQNLDRESKLLAAIDPSMMEASEQALKLLRGESAGITGAANAQRTAQREELVASLRSQYGPGAETSSIGQRALRSFDMETNTLTQQLNQSALGQVFGIATSDAGARQRSAIGQIQQVGQGYSALQERKLNTQVNTGNSLLGALSGTSQSMIQAAGAPYVGDALRGQAMGNLGNNLMNVAGMGLGGYMQGYGSAAGKA